MITYSLYEEGNRTVFDAHESRTRNVGYLITEDHGNVVSFDVLYVLPFYRGRGIGRTLLRQGITHHDPQVMRIKAEPFRVDGGYNESHNAATADRLVALYRSLGFRPQGEEGYMVRTSLIAGG